MKKLTVNVRRHSLSNKKDSKKDYSIGPEGWELAVEEGRKLIVPEGGIQAYASPKNRAQETARGVLFGAYQANYGNAEIVWGGEIPVAKELDSMVGYITRIPDVKKMVKSMSWDDAANVIFRDDPEAIEKAGKDIQDFINFAASNAEDNSLVEGVTHGPKVEAGLVAILGRPIKDMKEIGGACKETEFFSMQVSVEDSGLYKVERVAYKGQEMK